MKVEKGIKIPISKYPFNEMEVGDSFKVDSEKVATLRVQSCRFANENNVKFSILKHEGSHRCWRIK